MTTYKIIISDNSSLLPQNKLNHPMIKYFNILINKIPCTLA